MTEIQKNIQIGQSINLASDFLNANGFSEEEYLNRLTTLAKKIYVKISLMRNSLIDEENVLKEKVLSVE